jgi:hypothetical protein
MVNGKVRRTPKPIRELRVPVETREYRSQGDTRPYSVDFRRNTLLQRGLGAENNAENRELRRLRSAPSIRSIQRWIRRLRHRGTFRSYRHHGGRIRSAVSNIQLVYLAFYRTVFPEATAAEVIAFLWNTHGRFLPIPRFVHPSQITRAEQDLGFTRVRGSVTARQAAQPRVQHWREAYWTENYPQGIADIAARDLIDLDECGLSVETCKRKYIKVRLTSRKGRRYLGPYGHGRKLTLLMAISADPIKDVVMNFNSNVSSNAHLFEFL